MNSDKLTLVVDSQDSYLNQSDVFYIHPERLPLVRCLESEQFESCTIKNSPVDNLTSLNFSYILKKLKPNSVCEIVIHQPISVMQDYDAKQVEANAKLAGFANFSIKDHEYKVDNKKVKTLLVSFERPSKHSEEVDPKAQKGKPVKK
jgi:hypothetical protein